MLSVWICKHSNLWREKSIFFSMFKLCSQIWPNPGKGTIRTPLPETPPCRHVAPQRVGQLAPGATRGEHMQNGFQSLPVIRRKTSLQPWPYQEE